MNVKKNISDNQIASLLKKEVNFPLWLNISEAAKLSGVQNKTIRRAILSEKLKYRIVKGRYQVELRSVLIYSHSNNKLKNKLLFRGLGQYVKAWRD